MLYDLQNLKEERQQLSVNERKAKLDVEYVQRQLEELVKEERTLDRKMALELSKLEAKNELEAPLREKLINASEEVQKEKNRIQDLNTRLSENQEHLGKLVIEHATELN